MISNHFLFRQLVRVFSLAVTPDDTNQPPNLRTVGVQRISDAGIDFVMKKGSGTCDSLANGRPLSFLHLQGRYMPGETAEQWRGEGVCERMPVLQEEILKKLPSYTVVSMVAAKRLENEMAGNNETTNGSFDVSKASSSIFLFVSYSAYIWNKWKPDFSRCSLIRPIFYLA